MWLLELLGWLALGACFGAASIFLHARESPGRGGRVRARMLAVGAAGGFLGGLAGRALTDHVIVALFCAGGGAMLALAAFDRNVLASLGDPTARP